MSQPFDAVAATYDRDFTDRQLGAWLRDLVWEHVPFQAGEHILELGCGTGKDALRLARRGVQVTATDVSTAMLATAKQKVKAAGLSGQVTFQQLDLNRPDQFTDGRLGAYDSVLANFGALNCVEDRHTLADYLAQRVRVGGQAVLVVMGPLCPWEILWHLLRLKPAQAFRRWKAGGMAHVGDGEKIPVWYPSPRRLQSEFAPHFRHRKTIGIGTLLPPSYLAHLVDRWPGVFYRFAAVDRMWGGHLPMSWLNDHYMLLMDRV